MSAAQRFLDLLEPGGVFTFQTFDDDKRRKDPKLAKICHGTLDEHGPELTRLNERGAGVFVTVNATDGAGRTEANVVAVRAVFVDLDGSPVQPVLDADPHPSCVVETSPGRFHAYWLVDLPLDRFRSVQASLAARFGGDNVSDLPRVMRLPGFLHRKGEPSMVSLLEAHGWRYDAEHIEPLLPAASQSKQTQRRGAPALPDILEEGGRNHWLTSLAGSARARGCEREEIEVLLAAVNRRRCRPPLDERDLAIIIRSVCRYKPGERAPAKKQYDPMRWLRG